MKKLKLTLSMLFVALMFTQCTKQEELIPSSTTSSKSTSNDKSLTIGQQVAQLASFTAYKTELEIFPSKFLTNYLAISAGLARENYVQTLLALPDNPTSQELGIYAQNIGFTDLIEYQNWEQNVVSRFANLYTDPFFGGMTIEQIESAIKDGFDNAPLGQGLPIIKADGCEIYEICQEYAMDVYLDEMADCCRRGLTFDHLGIPSFGFSSDCSRDAQADLLNARSNCDQRHPDCV